VRRSIDDHPFDPAEDPVVADDPDLSATSWSVAIADDYEDGEPRVVLTAASESPCWMPCERSVKTPGAEAASHRTAVLTSQHCGYEANRPSDRVRARSEAVRP